MILKELKVLDDILILIVEEIMTVAKFNSF